MKVHFDDSLYIEAHGSPPSGHGPWWFNVLSPEGRQIGHQPWARHYEIEAAKRSVALDLGRRGVRRATVVLKPRSYEPKAPVRGVAKKGRSASAEPTFL